MPYKVTKVHKKGGGVCFRVRGPSGVHATCTTARKAYGQVAIMERRTGEGARALAGRHAKE